MNLEEGRIRLTDHKGKNGQERVRWCDIHPELRKALEWWREVRPCKADNVFMQIHCDGMLGEPFRQRSKLMGTLCKRAGVKPFGFHAIRHCSAAVTFKAMGLNGAQIFLGHSRATTTDRYVRSAGLYGSQDGILAALGALPQRRGHSASTKKWAYQAKPVCPPGQLLFSDQRKEEKALWRDC